jgi:dihydrofolate reductase
MKNSKDSKNQIFKAVGIVCFNKEDPEKVVVVTHGESATHLTGSIGLPSGRPEKEEADIQTALREFQEETGLGSSIGYFEDLDYPFGPATIKRKDGITKWRWHLYLCKNYWGELKSTNETTPKWVSIKVLKNSKNLLPNTYNAQEYVKRYLAKNTKISIIVATDEKNGIGKGGIMPWHISEDFKRFKEITTGHPVIMGRKTWESLPVKPLPNRYNIVITRDLGFKEADATAHSLEEGIEIAKKQEGSEEIFVIGGGQIFGQAIGFTDKLYITKIKGNFDADTFFPDYSGFKKTVFKKESSEGKHKYTFLELEK